MRRCKTTGVSLRFSARTSVTAPLLALLCILAACGSSTKAPAKTTATPVAPTATPPPKGWNTVASPPVGSEGVLVAVAALSERDAWAVGQYEGPDSLQRTLVEHWDGANWTQVPSPNSSERYNILSAAAAVSTSDIWAVGYGVNKSNKNEQLIEHWDGKNWTIKPNPTISQGDSTLSGVAAISASDVWAVGSTRVQITNGPYHEESLVEHWDGATWKVVPGAALPGADPNSSSFNPLTAVTAINSKDVWAVGASNQDPLIEHWDGAAWKVVPGASGPVLFSGLTGISATSASDVWAVGSGVPNVAGGCGEEVGSVIEHWDGARWSSVPFATPTGATGVFTFNTVAAIAANDAWVVGGFESSRIRNHVFIAPVIEHWDGARWSIVTSPANSTHLGFTGVAGLRGGPAWVVGQSELSNGAGPTLIEQWDGGKWAAVASPSPGTLSNELKNVAAISAKDVWAVGSSAGGTLAEHWDGASWNVIPSANGSPADNVLNGVAGTSPKDVWAVGYTAGAFGQGLIQHWDGSGWSLVPGSSASIGALYGVAALTSRDAWAVGDGIQHWDGARWQAVPGATFDRSNYDRFFGVAAVASNDVWAVGGQPFQGCGTDQPALIEHWDGARWSVIPNTPAGILFSVSAVNSADIWAVGTSLVMHWDGKQWSVVASTSSGVNLNGVSARASNDVWAVGSRYDQNIQQIVIQHWDGHAWTASQATGPGLIGNALQGVVAISASEAWAVGSYSHYFTYYTAQQSLIMRYIA
jgi:hypothetical protein